MSSLNVFETTGKRVLMLRETARTIAPELSNLIRGGDGTVTLDLSGINLITPSFLDEALKVTEECFTDSGLNFSSLIVAPIPTVLSSKYLSVAKAHGLSIREIESGDWEFIKG